MPLLIRDLPIDPAQVTVVDSLDNRSRIASSIIKGVTYEPRPPTCENLDEFLSRTRRPGRPAARPGVEHRQPDDPRVVPRSRRALPEHQRRAVGPVRRDDHDAAARSHAVRAAHGPAPDARSWADNRGPTAIIEHGANPGLVSHFAKQALTEIAAAMLRDGLAADPAGLEDALSGEAYNRLALLTGTKVIHIAERDTQISNVPKATDEFVNTWSVEGFYEEGVAPAELGWGTHERRLPPNAFVALRRGSVQPDLHRPAGHGDVGAQLGACRRDPRHGHPPRRGVHHVRAPDRQRCRRSRGVPADGALRVPPVRGSDQQRARAADARPEIQEQQRILNDEIVSGRDELGVLLMGHPYQAWWTGSLLSIQEARAVVPTRTPPRCRWPVRSSPRCRGCSHNPNEGLHVPDDLPWRDILRVAGAYLGTLHSGPATGTR